MGNRPYRHKSIRLKNYDYSQSGYYFVTICTHNRRLLFLDREIRAIVGNEWHRTERIRDYALFDKFVIMPNHIRGIIIIRENCRGQAAPDPYINNTINKGTTHRIAPTIHLKSLANREMMWEAIE